MSCETEDLMSSLLISVNIDSGIFHLKVRLTELVMLFSRLHA